jgi:hypothetical protein
MPWYRHIVTTFAGSLFTGAGIFFAILLHHDSALFWALLIAWWLTTSVVMYRTDIAYWRYRRGYNTRKDYFEHIPFCLAAPVLVWVQLEMGMDLVPRQGENMATPPKISDPLLLSSEEKCQAKNDVDRALERVEKGIHDLLEDNEASTTLKTLAREVCRLRDNPPAGKPRIYNDYGAATELGQQIGEEVYVQLVDKVRDLIRDYDPVSVSHLVKSTVDCLDPEETLNAAVKRLKKERTET